MLSTRTVRVRKNATICKIVCLFLIKIVPTLMKITPHFYGLCEKWRDTELRHFLPNAPQSSERATFSQQCHHVFKCHCGVFVAFFLTRTVDLHSTPESVSSSRSVGYMSSATILGICGVERTSKHISCHITYGVFYI